MNENLDLTKILEGCPKGTKFYCSNYGDVTFFEISPYARERYPIRLHYRSLNINSQPLIVSLTKDGRSVYGYDGECTLFPSKDQRVWSKFVRFWDKPKKERFDPKTLQPYDKVLAKDGLSSNMKAVTIQCRALMVGDWCCDKHEFPMQITTVGDDYAYATFEGNEGDPWEFDDKDDQPQPIPITPEILEKNGWKHADRIFMEKKMDENTDFSWTDRCGAVLYLNGHHMCDCKYVHELQRALRLCGLNELADNFKV